MVMPLVLLVTASLIIALFCIETEIKVKGALDRTAAELSLISPAGILLSRQDIDPESDSQVVAAINQMLREISPDANLESVLSDLTLDLVSSAVIGDLLQKRLDYWLAESWSGQPGWAGRLGSRRLFLDWQVSRQQLYLCLSYDLVTPVGTFVRHTLAVVPLWIGQNSRSDEGDEEEIWQLDNFSRGRRFRQLYGANLPDDFPVIASFSAGEAVMIKSIDLTAPTYKSEHEVRRTICRMIDDLSAFMGAQYVRSDQQVSITAESIKSRRLLLIIPENSRQSWLSNLLSEVAGYAEACSVILDVVSHGTSLRWQDIGDARPTG